MRKKIFCVGIAAVFALGAFFAASYFLGGEPVVEADGSGPAPIEGVSGYDEWYGQMLDDMGVEEGDSSLTPSGHGEIPADR